MTLRNPLPSVHGSRMRLSWAAATVVAAALAVAACGPTGTNQNGSGRPSETASSSASDTSQPTDAATAPTSAPATSSATPVKAKPSAGSGGSQGTGSGSSGGSSGAPANSPQAVRDAFAQAKADRKNVLLDFGATWCPACRTVLSLYALPSVQSELAAHYHLVKIDISNNDPTNMALLAQYDKGPSYGLPVMIVVTPDGTMRVDTNKTGHPKLNESGMLDWLKKWSS